VPRRRAAFVVTLALFAGVLALQPGASAAPETPPHLSNPNDVYRWTGRQFQLGLPIRPEACSQLTSQLCDERPVLIELKSDFFRTHHGAIEFSIRWESEYDDFDLFVYRPDKSLVAGTNSNIGAAESVFDHEPVNGLYRVVVAPKAVTDSDYEGLLQWEPDPVYKGAVRDLLPNLRTQPPREFHIVAPVFYQTGTPLQAGGAKPISCYMDESGESRVQKCLRFDNTIENVGQSNLDMRFKVDGTLTDPKIQQGITRTDGSEYWRDAGTFEFHAAHAHYHYTGFAHYQLYAINFSRRYVSPLNEGVKSGFCLEDTRLVWWGKRGNGPMRVTFPDCDLPAYRDDEGIWGVMGITRGWADVYTWDLPDQYVSLDGMRDGIYVLETTADSVNFLSETSEADNQAWSLIRIAGTEVQVLKDGRGPARNALSYYRP
jgi:hypothetical protein